MNNHSEESHIYREVTAYERELDLKLLYEAKDKELKEIPKTRGITIKINELSVGGNLELIVLEALNREDVKHTCI